ncbi:hypothetical protein ACI6QG_03005 [Roseococcus sp. DSY-14]|uniref:hypothetical protein n=1 Tax=Roseococcus sp. DSY-14 TaxID=3369650 RepID=UPI00387AB31B
MAFMLPIELDNTGVSAAYWRITHLQLDRNAGVLDAVLHGFRDEAARRAGKAPMHRLAFRFGPQAPVTAGDLAIEEVYRAIRGEPGPDGAAPLFAHAADI